MALFSSPCQNNQLLLDSLHFWKAALTRMKAHRATALPLTHARRWSFQTWHAFSRSPSARQGHFPDHMSRSAVSCVLQVAQPLTMAQCRPITVFSTVYTAYWRRLSLGFCGFCLEFLAPLRGNPAVILRWAALDDGLSLMRFSGPLRRSTICPSAMTRFLRERTVTSLSGAIWGFRVKETLSA